MELQPPRGTADLLPPRSDAILSVYDEAHELARRFGYRYVETPTFEQTELFARTSGDTSDVVSKEMFTFEDKGGRSMTLRPESTASVVRAFLANAQKLLTPFKAYYVHPNYRHGRPQAARLREFRVFGIEVLGTAAPDADVEVVELADTFLRDRGLGDVVLHLNSVGDEVCRPPYRDKLIAYLEPHVDELDEDCRKRLHTNPMRVLDCKVDGKKDFVLAAPLISDNLDEACGAHFAAVRQGLEEAGVAFEHDPHIVRGLDYYTRTAFEFVSNAIGGQQSTICGGGRYDGLATVLGGSDVPGVGFGMGIDRVLIAMETEGVELPPARAPRCFVVAIAGARRAGLELVRDLRAAGISTERALEDRPLGAQLRMADRGGARYAAILGERETESGVVTLRKLDDGTQEQVARADVVNWLMRNDGTERR